MNENKYQPREIKTCKIIKNNKYELGSPKVIGGKCEGYVVDYCDEPAEPCKYCKFCIDYVEDK